MCTARISLVTGSARNKHDVRVSRVSCFNRTSLVNARKWNCGLIFLTNFMLRAVYLDS
jgi:hypothetical protein